MNLHDFTPGTPALRPHNRQFLGDDQLHRICPAIFANHPHGEVSDRYAFIPTTAILAGLKSQGWAPVAAQNSMVRIAGKAGFQKHMIRFAPLGTLRTFEKVGDVLPELVVVNSHDRTSTFTFHAGLFRLACNNGLIVADASFSVLRARHTGQGKEDMILEAAFEVIKDMEALPERIEGMRAVALANEEQQAFAHAALMLRWPEGEHAPIQAPQLLLPRRMADATPDRKAKPDLFTTLNVVQENLMKGGLRGRTANNGRTRTRAVNSVGEDVRLNRALWVLAEALKGHKQAA